MKILCAFFLLVAGCAHPRFLDQPVVWRVDDTRTIPQPEPNEFWRYQYFMDIFLLRRSTRAMELRDQEPAWSTNALDEVPNSTWFTNRIGLADISPERAARGPDELGPPQLPLTIVAGKSGGGNPGFFVTDQTGRKFLVKFDTKDNPEMQTATDVIVGRIFWTIGYHVPADYVFHFRREDLIIGDKATVKNDLKEKRLIVEADVEEVLGTSPRRSDGSYRALASQFLPGIPLGGVTPEGVRDDDPNDTIPHEHRRELRGLFVFASWLNHTDMKEDNTLDMYVEEDGRKFVRHYLVDFGEALAAHAAEKGRYEDGFEHAWDWQAQPLALLALGLWKRPWESLEDTKWLSIGAIDAETFDPEGWHSAYPYWPFMESDAADKYWGAKIVMRFDRPTLEAIVKEGKFSHPEAAAYLVDTLLARRDKIGRTYLEAVTPLDHFEVRQGKLCAIDLSIQHGIATSGLVERLDDEGEAVEEQTLGLDGAVCFPLPPEETYQVYRLRVRRGHHTHPVMQVHLKGGDSARVLGIIRVEKHH